MSAGMMRRRSAAHYPGNGVRLVSTKAEHLTGGPHKSSAQVAHPTTRPKPETRLNPRLASTCPTALATASMSWHGRRDAPPAAGQTTSRLYIEETSFADLLRPPARTRSHHRPASLNDAFAHLLRPPARTRSHERPASLHDAFANLLRPSARTRNHHRPAPNFPVRSGAASRACAATRTNRPYTYAAASAGALDGLDSLMREHTRSVQAQT